jgi:diguanylate cyclase (GGDEF)-like protein
VDNRADLLEVVLRQNNRSRILEDLCRLSSSSPSDRQIAFFLLRQEEWQLTATGDLTPGSAAILASVVPEELSLALAARDGWLTAAGASAFSASELYSATGEVLGIFVCLNPDPALVEHYEYLCRLAALAVEHANLLEELTWRADHDALTCLYTRTAFERLLTERMQIASCSLICMNLDRFRLINGVLGHGLGDVLLRQIASRIHTCLSHGTVLARVGGDEFAVIATPGSVNEIAASVHSVLQRPFSIEGHQIYVTASIGIGEPQPASTPESLQREAYIALYHAKHNSRGRSVRFETSMAAVPPERLEMERCLRSALERHEMRVHYQPQVDIASGEICGVEALLRWYPPQLGEISPVLFIPILEETGLISEFGNWVIREACVQALKWREQTGVLIRMAVNVSASQFRMPGFAGEVKQILDRTGFPPESLEVELTESLFVGDFDSARRILSELHHLGIAAAIDDFGVGQSSLSYLHELPFQRLKIDQSFVRMIDEDETKRLLVENILRLAGNLKMNTIAEGIEGPGQLKVLQELGCEEGQGYLFSRPVPPDDFLALWGDRAAGVANMKR